MRQPTRHLPERILLLALQPIGDTLFATPSIRALRARYPDAAIAALVYPGVAPLMRSVPGVDAVFTLPRGFDPRGLARLLGTLRAARFDTAICFTSPAFKWISLLAGIRVRTYMKFDRLWWLLPGDHPRWRSTHEAAHLYDCARELDLPPWESVSHAPALALPEAARVEARALLPAGARRPLVALHPGGAWLGGLKRWPADRFAALGARLQREWDADLLLLGGPDDAGRLRQIARSLHRPPLALPAPPSLLASFALIERCDLFIGNDSGPLHAAAALGVRYAGIFGPTSVANFAPLAARADQGVVITPERSCRVSHYAVGGAPIWVRPCCSRVCAALADLPVDRVYARVEPLLPRRRATVPR